MLQKVLQYADGIYKFYTKFNTKGCITISYEVWVTLAENNIRNAWKKMFIDDDSEEVEENLHSSIYSDISHIIESITGQTTVL